MNFDDQMKRLKGKNVTLSPGWEVNVMAHSGFENMEGFGKAVIYNIHGMEKISKNGGEPVNALHLVATISQMLSKLIDETTAGNHTREELTNAIVLCAYYLGDMLMDDPFTKSATIDLYLEMMNHLTGGRLDRSQLVGL